MKHRVGIALALALVLRAAAAQEPKLPPGLGETKETEPALPPGLLGERDAPAEEQQDRERPEFPLTFHGFVDVRAGLRLQNDPVQPRDLILGETRLQLETDHYWDTVGAEYTGDLLLDGAQEEIEFDLRRLRLLWSPIDQVDIQAGRQVLTWGTGDLLFINDLFPKDWQAFFIGRDEEYLKAPADAIKVGWFPGAVNVDFVYTPRFEPDRYITGERLSFWNTSQARRTGRAEEIAADEPDEYFNEDEFALRIYRTFDSVETALYAYSGFWKSPAGGDPVTGAVVFPALGVYGASVRSPVGKGVANAEIGYYDSREDRDGRDPNVDNSEVRVLLGYERELASEFTAGIQYYLQHMRRFARHQASVAPAQRVRDQNRHTLTLRLTKLLLNQDLTLSLFTFYSPSDADAYFRPHIAYKATDNWTLEAGANVFTGSDEHTFLNQFENNTNIYAAARRSF